MIDVNHAGVLRFYVSLLALSGVIAASCGGGDDGGDDEASGGGGMASSAGSGGASAGAGTGGGTSTGSSGTSGGSGSGGAGGSVAAAPVPCGTATCEPGTTRFLRPCCFDEATAKCGTMIAFGGSMACNENVEADPRCESVMSRIGQIPSCCTEDMRCGISLAMFGMPGCTSIEEAQMIAMGDGGTPDGSGGSGGAGGSMSNPFAIDLPAPKACE